MTPEEKRKATLVVNNDVRKRTLDYVGGLIESKFSDQPMPRDAGRYCKGVSPDFDRAMSKLDVLIRLHDELELAVSLSRKVRDL